MVTLKEIAEECQVSTATVSNVLNGKPFASEETRQRVLEVVEKRGYKPNYIARGLRKQETKTIGIIADDIAQFTTPGIVEGVMKCCEEREYRTIVKNLRLYARWSDSWYDNSAAYHSVLDPAVEELTSIRVDGILYIAGHARIVPCFQGKLAMPTVMAYAYSQNPKVPAVLLDDETSSCEIIRYLTERGHRKIGVIGGYANNMHTQRRLLGYQKALFEKNIPYNPDLMRYAGWEKDAGYRETASLVQAGVTAIFCMADRVAGGVYCALDEMGMRAGTDISVVGFDNQDIAEYFVPGLTTMELPLHEIGAKAVTLLLDQLSAADGESGGQTGGEYLVPCSLIERGSVRDIRESNSKDEIKR
jgi:LacI family transcriptional regulator